MKFAPGTDPKKAQEALIAAGYPAPRTPSAATAAASSPSPTPAANSPATPVPTKPPRRGGGGRRGGRREGRRQAGMNFGLMPTEVIEQTRGRGYGLSYMPQQRTAKQVKFGGGGPQNVINFNPILSQQANPNIRIGVGGAEQTASPQFTASPVYSGGGGGGGGGGGYNPAPLPEVTPPPRDEIVINPDGPTKPGKPKNNYRRLMERYMRRFDRTAHGAGSKRGTDRFSAKDIRMMTAAGKKFGGSAKQVARDVLDYARDFRGKTKMGGSSRKALDKLQAVLGKRRSAEKKAKSKAAKAQRRKESKRSKKKSRAKAKAKAKAFSRSRKPSSRRGGSKKRGGKRRGGKRGKRR